MYQLTRSSQSLTPKILCGSLYHSYFYDNEFIIIQGDTVKLQCIGYS